VLVADLEHSSAGLRGLEDVVRGAELHGCPVIARLGRDQLGEAGRAIEAGAAGIQLSGVETPAQLEALRAAVTPAPGGTLGLSLSHRAAGYGALSAPGYLERVGQVVRIAQLESAAAVAALETLLESQDQPDLWFIGPLDLSADLGHPGELDHPEVQLGLERTCAALARARRAFGAFAPSADRAAGWRARGAALTLVGSDVTLLAGAARALAGAWRD
jgi:2-keto-3-deoxy-L-rhamnonate aldolase RhmA